MLTAMALSQNSLLLLLQAKLPPCATSHGRSSVAVLPLIRTAHPLAPDPAPVLERAMFSIHSCTLMWVSSESLLYGALLLERLR